MASDPVGHRDRRPEPPDPKPFSAPWWQRLGDAKLTPGIVLLFFLGLLILSVMAAGVGLVAHHFRDVVSRPR